MDGPKSEAARLQAVIEHIITVDQAHIEALLRRIVQTDRPMVISFVNQHALNLAADNETFRQDLLASSLLLRDGVGMEVCLRLLGRPPGANTNGTDLIPKILGAAGDRRVVVFGTAEPWLSKAVERLSTMIDSVVGIADGFQSHEHYRRVVLQQRPDLVLLAMGMPQQERLATILAEELDWPVLIINGGAILDFLAERFSRAPPIIQRLRGEWLYRLYQEPERLASRYIIGGAAFVRRIYSLKRHGGSSGHV